MENSLKLVQEVLPAWLLSSSPLQTFNADACKALAKLNDKAQGFNDSLFMALRFSVASCSLWPPDRNTIPAQQDDDWFKMQTELYIKSIKVLKVCYSV